PPGSSDRDFYHRFSTHIPSAGYATTTSLIWTKHFDNERIMAVKSPDVPYVDESSLPDPSQPQADFLDTSFFQRTSKERCELPSPASVLEKDARGGGRGTVAFPELNLLVKFDEAVYLRFDEAVTMRAIRQIFRHDEIPVPEIFGWRTYGTMNFIYMSLIHGKTLRDAWPSLTESDITKICTQLSHVVSSLRSITRGSTQKVIGSISGGPVTDKYFKPDYEGGPFANAHDFHDWVYAAATRQQPGPDMVIPEPYQAYRDSFDDQSKIYLTHGDLTLGNIIVACAAGSWKIVGIVDWEQSGWYPEYWEYCKLYFGVESHHQWRKAGWADKVIPGACFDQVFLALAEYTSWRGF
ncbi:hypothetical protein HII31_03604, partial [Pseudocercospora fuligena]